MGMTNMAITSTMSLTWPPVKEWHSDERGHFWIDAEESGAGDWLDYWSMSLIAGSDRLNRILAKHGLYFEWYNAGYAHVYDI